MDKQTALDLLDEKQDFLFSVSDSIWDNPETDYTETVSSGILMDALKKEGFTVTSGLAGIPTAFSGSYGSGSPVIGILGEFDALSGLSQKACATEKEALEPGGNGHGCGHNLLGTGSLAAAIAVKEYLKEIKKARTPSFISAALPRKEAPPRPLWPGTAYLIRRGHRPFLASQPVKQRMGLQHPCECENPLFLSGESAPMRAPAPTWAAAPWMPWS